MSNSMVTDDDRKLLAAEAVSVPGAELSDLVDRYSLSEHLPPADWVTRLNLVRPRRDLHCLSTATRFFKRVLDLSVGSVMLVLLAPVMLSVAELVRLTSNKAIG